MILVDTNVVSEPLRPKPSEVVTAWFDANFEMCAVSTITMMELAIGVQLLPAGRRRDRLQTAVSLALGRFGSRVLSFDENAARAAAGLLVLARDGGLPLFNINHKLADLQIAGIAAAHGCSLATRNIGDFRGLGIELIDPWSASASSRG
jgi:toxin FitB